MQIDLNRFREAFFEEANEHVANMETALLKLETSPDDRELLNEIFRAAHSIKGGSGTFGLEGVTRFTHSLESLLDKMREGEIAATKPLIDLVLRSRDVLLELLVSAKEGTAPPSNVDQVLGEIDGVLAKHGAPTHGASVAGAARPTATGASTWKISFRPARNIFTQGMDPLLVLREIGELGTLSDVTLDLARIPALDDLEPLDCHLSWSLRLEGRVDEQRIRDAFAFVEDGAEIKIECCGMAPAQEIPVVAAPAAEAKKPVAADDASLVLRSEKAPPAKTGEPTPRTPAGDGASIRVAVDKIDKLINLVGELVISQSMVSDVVTHFTTEKLARLNEAVAQMERNTRELQERVMSVRMVPIGSIFSRFPRVVRDLAGTLNKKVNLVMAGEETELDKGVVERIGDPLTHLIRNALDHGIEGPEDRLASGKREEGTIRLAASTQGGTVVIEVSDDGRGLNTERIRKKGIERGLLRPDDQVSDEQIHQMIFEPAFSTADKVTDVSGRGVGMDVVKKNVEALNGTVSIVTRKGEGSRFVIKLPLTLAILDGLTLAVGDQSFVLPLVSIVESLRPRPEQIKSVLGRGQVVMVRGEARALVRLHRVLGVPPRSENPSDGIVVIVENQGDRVAILVDELLGQQQVVIKTLDTNFRRVEGVMGATIMGDGRVALILDVGGLVRIAQSTGTGVVRGVESEVNVPVGVA